MACFNRRELTLRCLSALKLQKGLGEKFSLKIFLVDDASPDGTGTAVRQLYPDTTIFEGNGSLFWGGGMNRAMQEAAHFRSDYMLLLNDDVDLDMDAISYALEELETCQQKYSINPLQMLVGATRSPNGNEITYSGYWRSDRLHPLRLQRIAPSENCVIECDTVNGNFLLVPRAVVERLGPIDASFVHQLGDIDYGYRQRKLGGKIWLATRTIGTCAANPRRYPHRAEKLGIRERWIKMNTPLGMPIKSWSLFMWRHGGIIGILILLMAYAREILGRNCHADSQT